LIHVPLLIHLPGQAERIDVGRTVSLVDVVPSVLVALGMQLPDGVRLEGRTLPLGDPGRWADVEAEPVFSETMARGTWYQSLVYGSWKLILDRRGGGSELYNLDRDPGEQHNRAAQEFERTHRLTIMLNAWNQRIRSLAGQHRALPPTFTDRELKALKSLGYL
jgi:arylsulfatase A-like enzyme